MNIFKNYIYNLIYQVLVIILPIITTPFISRVLKVEGVGRYSVSVAVVNYFVLFGMLGISTYGNRQIACVRDNKEKMSRLFWEINILKLVSMSISICAYVLFLLTCIPLEDRKLYSFQIFTLIASLIDISWFFYGLEEFKKTAARNIIIKLISVFCIFILIRKPEDVWKYALIIALSTFLGQCILWIDIYKKILFIAPDLSQLYIHLKHTFLLWLPALAIQIYSSLDKVMLGALVNDTQAGLYENSQKLVKIASTITTALSMVTMPRISNYYQKGNTDGFTKIVEQSFSLVSFLSIPMAFGILAVRETLVPWFYGNGYEEISQLLIISTWLIITLSWSSIFGTQMLIGCKKEKQFTIAVTLGAVINVILNFLFIKKFQAAGVLFASVIAEYTGMLIMLFFIRKMVNIHKLFAPIPKYFVCSVLMYVPAYLIGKQIGNTITSTCVQLFVGISIYILLMIITKDTCFYYIWNKVVEMIRRNK